MKRIVKIMPIKSECETSKRKILELFERGLISARTVLELFGFDSNQEITRR